MHASPTPRILVAGLCAQWCGTCREWRAVFDAQARQYSGADFTWVDVEDHDEVMCACSVVFCHVMVLSCRNPSK